MRVCPKAVISPLKQLYLVISLPLVRRYREYLRNIIDASVGACVPNERYVVNSYLIFISTYVPIVPILRNAGWVRNVNR
jgi:hypothetical protein